MREIKFEYILQHIETKEISKMSFTLEEIEKNTHMILDCLNNGYSKVIARRQYVGQKDKNKIEIRMGDICTYKNKQGTHVGVIKFINSLNAFRLVFVDREEFYFISEENEIIGNIYENTGVSVC